MAHLPLPPPLPILNERTTPNTVPHQTAAAAAAADAAAPPPPSADVC